MIFAKQKAFVVILQFDIPLLLWTDQILHWFQVFLVTPHTNYASNMSYDPHLQTFKRKLCDFSCAWFNLILKQYFAKIMADSYPAFLGIITSANQFFSSDWHFFHLKQMYWTFCHKMCFFLLGLTPFQQYYSYTTANSHPNHDPGCHNQCLPILCK